MEANNQAPSWLTSINLYRLQDRHPGRDLACRLCSHHSAAALITAYTGPYTPLTAPCRSVTQANPKELVCQNGRYHDIVTNRNMYLETDTIRFDEWGGTFDTTIIVAYDSDCTMSTKMCLSFNTYGFTGGYVIFDVHFHYLCSAPPAFVDSKGDFGVVKWAKVNMHKNYAGLHCEKLC
ncbi:uncharacterized protein LOC135377100 isoform X5 [Ornithodoros turicata]|uniref:uncharacterized protein LOC135377100 isoform X5 n=1 Tax=Ornithodoros turicata TaxID=34597 RepID=UPI003138B17D